MLLEFKVKNYKSFADEMVFSMIPTRQKDLDYSILSEKIGNKNRKALCSSVIYGPNAAGKTNIISAMDTLRSIVLRGNVNNAASASLNVASSILELIPNCNSGVQSTEFSISFIENKKHIYYSLSVELGEFFDIENKNRKIISEELKVNDKEVFKRYKDNLDVGKFDYKDYGLRCEIAKSHLSDEKLFLTNGFANIFSPEIVNIINEWFGKKLLIIYQSNLMHATNANYRDVDVNDVAKVFGINSSNLRFMKNEDGICLYSLVKHAAIPADEFESYGTIRLINEFPAIIDALIHGGTLVIDEFDASIHPMALMNIIEIFHNDDINKNNAQLIFNTHNPIFLNSSLFRRDEIKFVERDEETNNSTLYSLSDFGKQVKKEEDYMKNYFVDRYGAIQDVDFTPVIKKVFKNFENSNANDVKLGEKSSDGENS